MFLRDVAKLIIEFLLFNKLFEVFNTLNVNSLHLKLKLKNKN